jgi:hypothetical protein
MTRSTSLALLSAGLVALAGCSDAASLTAPKSSAPETDLQVHSHYGIVPVRGAQNTKALFARGGNGNGAGAVGAAVPTGNQINYHNGPVLMTTKVAAVYWASARIYNGGPTPGTTGAGSADGSLTGYVMAHLGGSPYFNINTTYTNSAGTAISNSVTYTQFWANNSYSVPSGSTSVSDASMLSMLAYAFNNGKLTYDANTLYNIFTSGTVNLGGGFGTQYCAYHSDGYVTVGGVSKHVLYSAEPYDWGHSSACSAGYAAANGDAAADAEVSTLSHEIEETTTDPYGTGWWSSTTGEENADMCAWTFGSTFGTSFGTANITLGTKSFLIQQNWVNRSGGYCAKSF